MCVAPLSSDSENIGIEIIIIISVNWHKITSVDNMLAYTMYLH